MNHLIDMAVDSRYHPQAIAIPNQSIKRAQKPPMGTKKGTAHRRSHDAVTAS